MVGTDIWSRICSNGQPAVYCTQNSGKSWYRQDIGFPIWNAWFTVLSRCMIADSLKNYLKVIYSIKQPNNLVTFDQSDNLVDKTKNVKIKYTNYVNINNL